MKNIEDFESLPPWVRAGLKVDRSWDPVAFDGLGPTSTLATACAVAGSFATWWLIANSPGWTSMSLAMVVSGATTALLLSWGVRFWTATAAARQEQQAWVVVGLASWCTVLAAGVVSTLDLFALRNAGAMLALGDRQADQPGPGASALYPAIGSLALASGVAAALVICDRTWSVDWSPVVVGLAGVALVGNLGLVHVNHPDLLVPAGPGGSNLLMWVATGIRALPFLVLIVMSHRLERSPDGA